MLYKKLLIALMKTKGYRFFIMKILPYIRFSMYYTKMSGKQYNLAYRQLKPSDIILALDTKKATAFLVPGFTTHAAGCIARKIDRPCEFEVAEMTHHDYTKSDFFDLCKEADRILVLECVDYNEQDKQIFVENLLSFQKAKYDIEFDLNGIASLYCSEMIYQADKKGPNKMQLDLTDIHSLGTEYISPDGILFGKNIRVKYDTGLEFTGLMGPESEKLCIEKGYIKKAA